MDNLRGQRRNPLNGIRDQLLKALDRPDGAFINTKHAASSRQRLPSLGSVADFRCRRYKGDDRPLDGRPVESIVVGSVSLGVVDNFCYPGDVIGGGDGAEESSIARVRSGWKKFRELLSISTSRVLSLATKGRVFEEFVKCVVLYGSEVWAVKEHDLARLERNDMTMIRWICRVRLRDRLSSDELRCCLGLDSIRNADQKRRLRWVGHVERMNADK